MARLNFSRKTLRLGHERAARKCERCEAALKPGEGEGDHILAAELGGEATLANLQIICRVCHKEKTARDIRMIRKADRQRDKATGAIPSPARPLLGRGFAKKERKAKPSLPPRRLYRSAAE